MPELPEVETTRRGIAPHALQRTISSFIVRQSQLRWPVPQSIQQAVGQKIIGVERRAKYLLIQTYAGTIVFHLGMSGNLTIQLKSAPILKHDHIDVVLDDGNCIRFNDSRRFGACLWQANEDPPLSLFNKLGPEPLTNDFNGAWLYQLSRDRTLAVKNFIMNNSVVVGVGNIYANEALFSAGIDPRRAAGRISLARYNRLAEEIRTVLCKAIEHGGTTLRDFVGANGQVGYFRIQLNVYNKAGKNCCKCDGRIQSIFIGQRNSFFCSDCQH
ncbi:MAG: bifunctional DNA-formamidopyrimidine glycosylase/DNA-(apurinic or apyrimidinic site) lyase [Verrucomicrobiota bacterium]|nr:bifunctional DNA-formamidopyrimidine glycosylase/DNA-(apurinic or apyrimidinic site) lyase [Verrucomicrobiota bacterium]MEC8329679.1 bifunctional DNA-formamidopyrimidine glycosylase/DNA-(apurinic or apyrimidinic site) lyase [Verrucomicrobiota bacterium]